MAAGARGPRGVRVPSRAGWDYREERETVQTLTRPCLGTIVLVIL